VKSRLLYQQTAFPKKLTIKILSAPGDCVPGLFNLVINLQVLNREKQILFDNKILFMKKR